MMRSVIIFFLIVACVIFSTIAHSMGGTEVTIENLKREISKPRDLSKWMKKNLVYRNFANDLGESWTHPCLKTGVADCDDYARLAHAWLSGATYYNPKLAVIISRDRRVHMICMFYDGGYWNVFSNDQLIRVKGDTVNDVAKGFYRDWLMFHVLKNDITVKVIYADDGDRKLHEVMF